MHTIIGNAVNSITGKTRESKDRVVNTREADSVGSNDAGLSALASAPDATKAADTASARNVLQAGARASGSESKSVNNGDAFNSKFE